MIANIEQIGAMGGLLFLGVVALVLAYAFINWISR
jgi:hypothetical protein